MDCYRCLKGAGNLVKLTYPNGDTQKMYLCGECIENFETDGSVSDIARPQAA